MGKSGKLSKPAGALKMLDDGLNVVTSDCVYEGSAISAVGKEMSPS